MKEPEYPMFLNSEIEASPPDRARYHVLPVPMEHSVSYGRGTADGPRAILEAARQLELFDGIDIPATAGIYTAPPVDCSGPAERVVERIRTAVAAAIENGALPLVLGGEHTVTVGALGAFELAGVPLGVVQFDAHADLRDTYEGSRLSHACVMRRVVELGMPVFQIGVRSLSLAEHDFRDHRGIRHLDAQAIRRHGVPAAVLPEDFPERLYVTFDVDAFDPAVMPATGTPEPGGIDWYEALTLLERVVAGRRVAGFDIVELAPVPGLHMAEFTAAKLAYAAMGIMNRRAVWPRGRHGRTP